MEKVIFSMPEDPEMFLATLSAVQSWQYVQRLQKEHETKEINRVEAGSRLAKNAGKISAGQFIQLTNDIAARRKMTANRDVDLTIHMPSHEFDWLMRAFGSATFTYDEYKPMRMDWDLAYKFDPDLAYAFGSVTGKHAAAAFEKQLGMLIDVNRSYLPNLGNCLELLEGFNAEKVDVLFVAGAPVDKIAEYLAANRPELVWAVAQDTVWLQQIFRSEMVVGPRSLTTYIASALDKRVVELYPTNRYQNWLAKWGNPNYQMLYGDAIPAAYVWRAMEVLWARTLATHQADLELSTPTEQRTFVAGLAVASLPGQETLESVL